MSENLDIRVRRMEETLAYICSMIDDMAVDGATAITTEMLTPLRAYANDIICARSAEAARGDLD